MVIDLYTIVPENEEVIISSIEPDQEDTNYFKSVQN